MTRTLPRLILCLSISLLFLSACQPDVPQDVPAATLPEPVVVEPAPATAEVPSGEDGSVPTPVVELPFEEQPELAPTSTPAIPAGGNYDQFAPITWESIDNMKLAWPPLALNYGYDASYTYPFIQIVFRPQGPWLAQIGPDALNRIHLIDVQTGSPITVLEDDQPIYGLNTPSPDGRWLASVNPQIKRIGLWDLENFVKTLNIEINGFDPNETFFSSAFSDDNRYLAVAGCRTLEGADVCLDGGITVYAVDSGAVLGEYATARSGILYLGFKPGTHTLVGTGFGENLGDAALLAWDTNTGSPLTAFPAIEDGSLYFGPLAFNTDGQILAAQKLFYVPTDNQTSAAGLGVMDTNTWAAAPDVESGELLIGGNQAFLPGNILVTGVNELDFYQLDQRALKTVGTGLDGFYVFTSPDGRLVCSIPHLYGDRTVGAAGSAHCWGVPLQ